MLLVLVQIVSAMASGFIVGNEKAQPNATRRDISNQRGVGLRVNQDLTVDFEYCFRALHRHDYNDNLRVDVDEFFGFAQDFGGTTECLGALDELPLELVVVFNQLACECRHQGGQVDCCLGTNAIIPIAGASTGFEPDDPEQDYLRQVCLRTDQAIISFCSPVESVDGTSKQDSSDDSNLRLNDWVTFDKKTKATVLGGAFLFLLGVIASCRCLHFRTDRCRGGKKGSASDASSVLSGEDYPCSEGCSTNGWIERDEETSDKWIFSPLEQEGKGEMSKHVYRKPGLDKVSPLGGSSLTILNSAHPEESQLNSWGCMHKRDLDLGELEKEWEDVVSAAYYEHHLAVDDDFLPTLDLSPISLKSDGEDSEEPYDLEHYVPDGGTVMFDKGVWNYLADGGWSATEETIPPTTTGRKACDRKRWREVKGVEAPESNDFRRNRKLRAYDGAEVFLRLEVERTTQSSKSPLSIILLSAQRHLDG